MPPRGFGALATQAAERTINELRLTTLPIDPFALAKRLDIEVRPLPPQSRGVSGMLLYQGGSFGILYATYLDNPGFERFSVGHELGHYYLPGHPEHVLDESGIHVSDGGFVSERRFELEADHFSAGLLMPRQLFIPALNRSGEGLAAVETLADQCLTSLTATAIRYSQCTEAPVAVVMSTGSAIDYCFMSDALREIDGLEWLKKGTPLSPRTATAQFNRHSSKVRIGDRAAGVSELQDWFGGRHQVELTEEVVGLGKYGRTLTILMPTEPLDQESLDDEEDLQESWEPRFRR